MSIRKCKRCGSLKRRSKGSFREIDGCSDCTKKFPDSDIDKIVNDFWKKV